MAPRRTLATLAAGAIVCDVVRFATGVEALGLLDMTFVWLFAQQLGFWIADGWFRAQVPRHGRRDRRRCLPLLFGLVGVGYPGNMLDNLNPPTFAIVALAVGQTCLLVLAHPALERLMALRPVRVVVATVGSRLDDDLPVARAGARARHRPAAAHPAADARRPVRPHGG